MNIKVGDHISPLINVPYYLPSSNPLLIFDDVLSCSKKYTIQKVTDEFVFITENERGIVCKFFRQIFDPDLNLPKYYDLEDKELIEKLFKKFNGELDNNKLLKFTEEYYKYREEYMKNINISWEEMFNDFKRIVEGL